jgi:hypothetical protein
MLHTQIENEDIVERYVRNKLPVAERRAFEEHFLGCDECFDKLQTTERFVAGFHDAARRGLLPNAPALSRSAQPWFKWGFAATACASAVLAALTGWTYLAQMPKLREERDRLSEQLQMERQTRAAAETRAPITEQAEANVPLVMLQTTRAEDPSATVVLEPAARRLVLWIDLGPSQHHNFRLDIFSGGRQTASLTGLERGPYGAIAASVPVDQLPTGEFRLTLTAQDPPPAFLAGEYHLRIRRR